MKLTLLKKPIVFQAGRFYLLFLFTIFFQWTVKMEGAEKTVTSPKKGDMEFGLLVGSPTGLSFKYRSAPNQAIKAGLGFPFDSDVKFDFHTDYTFQFPIRNNLKGELPFYMGLGGRLRSINKSRESQKVDFGL